ncbi:MAG TPA: CBS domain-containing protein [Ramlibacter sp.]|nr:CBS domain-containing protein [Ramlibacter sp.]
MDAYPPLPRHALGSTRLCRPDPQSRSLVTFDSPAVDVMTDLTQVQAATIEPHATMDTANDYMIQRGVRMLLAVDRDGTLAGIITANDILGEKPVALVREQRIRHADIMVSDVMTPATRLDAFDMAKVKGARVGHVVSSLQESRRHHALVMQQDANGRPEVRGIFSLTQIARQLGEPLQLPEAAGSFSEIEAALAAG